MKTTTKSIIRVLLFSLLTLGALVYLTQCTTPTHSEVIMWQV